MKKTKRKKEAQDGLLSVDWPPSIEMQENDSEFVVKGNFPDIQRDDLHVEVKNGTLSICAEKKSELEKHGSKNCKVGNAYEKFTRIFKLPEGIDPSHVVADFEDGVLEIHLEKRLPRVMEGEGVRNRRLAESASTLNSRNRLGKRSLAT